MELHEYANLDAVGLRELIGAHEVSAEEVETVARQALERANADVNGLAVPLFSPALAHADDGPFAGVPFLIKDSGPFAEGVPFFLGSNSLGPGVVARHDHELMARFRAAGLVALGLTTVPELAVSFSTESVRHGPTRNPWALDRGVGGSSGGAAALVAAGAVPVAHANDSAGSIRVPASCCGLVGLKPSRGRTPCGPDLGEAVFGTSSDFVLTRTVRDAEALLHAVAGPGVGDKYGAPPLPSEPGTGPLRVAVTTRAWSGVAVDPEVAAAAVRAGRVLEGLGHVVVEASPAVDWDTALRAAVVQVIALGAPFLTAPRRPDPARMEAVLRRILELAGTASALDLVAGFDAQNTVSRSVGAFFTDHDLLVTPTLGRLPLPHGALRYDDPEHTVTSWLDSVFAYGPFTLVFNISGQPALSLPLGHSANGLPIGVQLVAPTGREDLLFRVARQLEDALPWRDRVPPHHVGRGLRAPSSP
ncbi:amidase [Umezawaea tangerina]|uniref:Amidase n=1 Tax=Umezawaea tangerina TaxID=84725 RepID=A0A2T0T4M4_9PSEU|nr:amidase [Umezawaea tangerina]PRY40620.1 amidase [Umezawaea tangerina]